MGARRYLPPMKRPAVESSSSRKRPAAAPPSRRYRRAVMVRSSKDAGERLAEVGQLRLGEDGSDGSQDSCIYVCPSSVVGKPFLGFGGSFTEAASTVFDKMPAGKQQELLSAYFDKEAGLGYELGRISMGSCDFGLGNWTCGDLADGDMALTGFSIEHYKASILPLYKRAEAAKGGPFTLLASPWSPVPWMKTKRKFDGDGHLRPECRDAWALHYAKFVKALRKEAGINVWGVTVQNEPEAAQIWESCIYSAEEERDFVRDHLGPTLARQGLGDVKILVWDHNRDGMLERAAVAYADPEAAKYIWGLGYHWYGDARYETWPQRSAVLYEDRTKDRASIFEVRARVGFDNVRAVAELRPDKHILFTEGCQELSGIPLSEVLGMWKYGERYGMNIIHDLNSGTEGWIDWNLYLDETGGPNHVDNLCVAPIICNTRTGEVLYQAAYWYLGHFSRYIRPGALRVLSSTSRDVLEVVAFLNLDGSLAVVVMNQSEDDLGFWLKVAGCGSVYARAVPRSITTFLVDDLMVNRSSSMHYFRCSIQTQHATFVKVTDGSAEEGATVQTASECDDWETFEGHAAFGSGGEMVCTFRSHHGTWLSVGVDGEVAAAPAVGDQERMEIVPRGGGRYGIKASKAGLFLSVSPGVGTSVRTAGAVAGDRELFQISGLPKH